MPAWSGNFVRDFDVANRIQSSPSFTPEYGVVQRQRHAYKRLRVMAEYSSSGIWAAEPISPFRHGMVRHARLGLPIELAARFEAWIETYLRRLESTFDTTSFNTEGRGLAKALKQHVGPGTEAVFAPEAEDGRLDAEEVIDA